ncbi:MAG: outer membrane protein transport protein [Chryseotalea sp. WA131a]|nr:MAG: outer membrane protein transport protein [Chryseotalea sp. WA131a]
MRLLFAMSFVFVSVQIFAQDTHYWTYRYGTKAVLMGGPAVGGLEDNTSVIYNPALLSFVKSTSISINSNIYQIVNITAKNGAGPGQDVISNQFSAVPITLSGMIRKKKPRRLTMGYAIIVPSEFTFKATAREDGFKDIVTAGNESPGAEDYVGQFTIYTRLSENQGAFALAYKINDHWSVGLTNQFSFRSLSFTKNELCRMILNNSQASLVSTSESQSIEYTNLRYTAKIGVGFSSGKWSAGVAVLLPSIGLAGSGTIARDIVANNLQVNIEPNPNKPPILVRSNIAANDRQEKLATTYNTPLSISAGFAYKGTDFLVAASAEWFGSVSLYNIMSPQDNLFKRPTTLQLDGKKFLEVNASNKSIINFAIGAERSISDRLSLSTGFRTNRSFYDKAFDQRITDRNGRTINNNPLNLDISSWDVYHVVLGATLKQERRDLSIGITYSWANDGNIRQFANFDQPTENTFLLGQKLTTTASYYSFGVLLGYTLRVRSEN